MSGWDMEAVERWFIRRGVPHFIDGYSATEDIFTRASPLLTVIVLFELLLAANFAAWWANTLAVLGGSALVVAIWALVNRARGRRPFQLPRSVGTVELAVFVLVPALVPLVFGGEVGSALLLVAVNLGLLLVIYAFTSYGIVPITVWATRRVVQQLTGTLRLLARALPLLLLAITFLFINAEVWEVAGGLFGPFFVATIALFATFGGIFAIARLPREVGELGRFESASVLGTFLDGTPLAGAASSLTVPPDRIPLDRSEWANVGLVVLFAQAVQVAFVVAMTGGFLVVLGLLAVPADVVTSWTGGANVLVEFTMFDRTVQLTEELLRVAGFLGAFSGLYFAVAAVTDASYREEFFSEVIDDVRQAMAVRTVYRFLVRSGQLSK